MPSEVRNSLPYTKESLGVVGGGLGPPPGGGVVVTGPFSQLRVKRAKMMNIRARELVFIYKSSEFFRMSLMIFRPFRGKKPLFSDFHHFFGWST